MILRKEVLANYNGTLERVELANKLIEVERYIKQMSNPKSAGVFILHDAPQSNGVKSIKDSLIDELKKSGWKSESRIDLSATLNRPGPIDATYKLGDKYIALEWETGNISSSHRALNKMFLGLLNKTLICGILVLPSRNMYKYLTDRVGNYQELEPYLPVWKAHILEEGALVIYEIEQDSLSADAPRFPKGTDGRSKV